MIQALLTYNDHNGLDLDLFNTEAEALTAVREKIRAYVDINLPEDFDDYDALGLSNFISDEDLDLQFSIMPLFPNEQTLKARLHLTSEVSFPADRLTLE